MAERIKQVEIMKWLGIAVLFAALMVASAKLSNPLFNGVLWIVGLLVVAVCVYHTVYGEAFVGFARESRIELRKVAWPDRKATVMGTLMVIVAVMIVAAFLMLVDASAGHIVGWITGQKV